MTADPWAFIGEIIEDRVRAAQRSTGHSYVNQSLDFFEAAKNPHLASRPLLYYYSFLNLVKAALLIRGVRLSAKPAHGIADPRSNQRERLRLGGQRVIIDARAADRSNLAAEFIVALGAEGKRRDLPVVELLGQIPSIHRAFTRITERAAAFTPIKRVEILRAGGELWARMVLDRYDRDVIATLPALKRRRAFRRWLSQKLAPVGSEIWLETDPVPGQRRGVDAGIERLAEQISEVGISSILTSGGYRFYLSGTVPRYRVPSIAASYAAFFYLGSVTRYRPDAFDTIVEGGYSWLVNELIATEPLQFVYSLASWLAGVDVVRPFAATL